MQNFPVEYVYKQRFSLFLSLICAFLFGIIGAIIVVSFVPIFYKLGIVVFLMMTCIFFTHPLFAMMMFFFVRPLIEGLGDKQIVSGIPFSGIFPLLIISILIFKFLSDKSYTIAIPNIGLLLFLLPISVFSMFHSVAVVVSIVHLLKFLGWLSVYIFVFNIVKTKEDARKIMLALVFSSVIPLLVGYYQIFTHTGYIDKLREITRVTSVFGGQPDPCATYFSSVFLIMLFLYIHSKNLLTKRLLFVAMPLTFIVVIFTYHRVSWIGLTVGIGIILLFNKKMIKYAIPLLLLGIIIFHAEIVIRIREFFEPPPTRYAMNSLTARTNIWKICISELIPRHPFLGSGIGLTGILTKKYFGEEYVPHNDFLRLSVELGIFGTILYFSFMIKEIRYYLAKIFTKSNRELNVIVLAILIFFVISSVAQNVFYNVMNMTVIFAMLAISKKMNFIEDVNSHHSCPN